MLSPGDRLGRYEVESPLGAGGMGEVYRARDTELDREVAIKVLPAGALADEGARKRFRKEARALCRVSHPHVAGLFDFQSHDGVDFLVMELVEGPGLDATLKKRAFSEKEVLGLGSQIVRALVAAHEHGVVHRDLKPSNVRLTSDGLAKVIDFGLARVEEPFDEESPTETSSGLVVGTPPYMSPEQLTGREVDARTDIHAVGTLLYEMATGRRPFGSASGSRLVAAILNEAPPSPRQLTPEVSSGLESVILKAMDKDPVLRYQTATELLVDLERLAKGQSAARRTADRAFERCVSLPPRTPVRAAGFLVVAGLLLTLAWWLVPRRQGDEAAPPTRVLPFTAEGGNPVAPRFSPDGERVAYMWAGPEKRDWDIYVRALGAATRALRLTERPGWDYDPVWSPDGREISYVRADEEGAAVYTVPSFGGQERKLFDIRGLVQWPIAGYLFPARSWAPDGTWMALAEKRNAKTPARILRVSPKGLQRTPLTAPEGGLGDLYPAVSPDGRLLAFVRSVTDFATFDVWVQPVSGGEARRLTFEGYDRCESLNWTDSGDEIVFEGDAQIFRVGLDGGPPEPVPGVGQNARFPSLRGDRMVYVQMTLFRYDIWRAPARGAGPESRHPERLISSTRHDSNGSYSPNGRRIAFESNRTGATNIWVADSDGSRPLQLTHLGFAGSPRWSPGGTRIAFNGEESGRWSVYVVDAEGGVPRELTPGSTDEYVPHWAADGRWIYCDSNRSGSLEIWKIPVDGGPWIQVTRGGGTCSQESPDGRYLYFMKSKEDGDVWRMPVDGGDPALVLKDVGWTGWAVARSGVYFRRRSTGDLLGPAVIWHLDPETGDNVEILRLGGGRFRDWMTVSSDEAWILYDETPAPESELMLVENFR